MADSSLPESPPFSPTTRWFPPDDAARYRAAGYWRDDTFAEFLADAAASFGDREAVIGHSAAGEPRRFTYRELLAAARQVRGRLASHGIGPGDRVVIALPNVTDYVTTLFGLFELGAVPVFALPAHRFAEISHFVTATQARALVTVDTWQGFDHRELARRVIAEAGPDLAPGFTVFIAGSEPQEFPSLTAEPPLETPAATPARPHPESLAFLQVSGGTTGLPKLIPRTHADYLYSVRASADICALDEDTRMLVVLPVSHNFTMSSPGILGVLLRGGTVVLARDPSPGTCFRLIEEEGCTFTSLVPPVAMTWLSLAPVLTPDLSTLDVLQVGGAKFTEEAASRVRPVLGCRLQQVFGMAEGLVNYTRDDDPADLVLGTQGRPISPDDEILILDDDDRPVPPGERGHLLTRGPYTIRGYLGGVDAASFTADGFYRTGDIVRQLPSGHLVVEGRAKDQINRGGEKISAEEVENHLLAHPEIRDAAVVSVPDAVLGERCCAYVITGAHGKSTISPDLVRGFLRDRGLATYKIPDRVVVTDHFPVTGVGKISRRHLRRELAAAIAAPTITDEGHP